MSEWINVDVAKPPESHIVLLYVVSFYKNCKDIWDDKIYVGFYGDEDYGNKGFYVESISKDGNVFHEFLEQNAQFKVVAWTLLPRKPYKEIFEGSFTG